MLFETIDYLKNGNKRQQAAYRLLSTCNIMDKLSAYTPILTGTIPINIDIEDSDLDIICYFKDGSEFAEIVEIHFSSEIGFTITKSEDSQPAIVFASFIIENTWIEIFGQNIPSEQQLAYRHMIIEHKLLMSHGNEFREKIIALKRDGLKTEPAFALLLGLQGDPYLELLKLE